MTDTEKLILDVIENNYTNAKKLHIAWVSAHPMSNTGYGSQTREVVGRLLLLGYNIICIAGGGRMDWSPTSRMPIKLSNNELVEFTILPTIGSGSGIDQWHEYKTEYHFDLVITLWDSFMVSEYTAYDETVEGIHHIPIDAPYTQEMFQFMKDANCILAMSKYGFNQLLKWHPIHKVNYIPHAIDTNVYYPFDQADKLALREKYNLKEENFVFLYVAANAGIRKRIPNLLNAFSSLVKQGYKEIYLYLFTNYSVPYNVGFNIKALCNQLGIANNVIVPRADPIRHPYTIDKMVEIYNLADCYISFSQGEGFALPVLESLSCGLPVIAPDNSTMKELLDNGKNGWLIKNVPNELTSDYMFGIPTNQVYPLPDEYMFRLAMIHALKNRAEGLEKGFNARLFVERNYTWKNIIPQWEQLISRQTEKIVLKQEIKENMK